MKTDAIVRIYCATCHESLDLCYSHGSMASRTLADDIKHDATISSDWWTKDDLFYCDGCWQTQENTRDEQAKLALAEDNDQWEKLTDAAESLIPYASAILDNLNGGDEHGSIIYVPLR